MPLASFERRLGNIGLDLAERIDTGLKQAVRQWDKHRKSEHPYVARLTAAVTVDGEQALFFLSVRAVLAVLGIVQEDEVFLTILKEGVIALKDGSSVLKVSFEEADLGHIVYAGMSAILEGTERATERCRSREIARALRRAQATTSASAKEAEPHLH